MNDYQKNIDTDFKTCTNRVELIADKVVMWEFTAHR